LTYQVLCCGLNSKDISRLEAYLGPYCMDHCSGEELLRYYDEAVCVIVDPSSLSEGQWYFISEKRHRPCMPILFLVGSKREDLQYCLQDIPDVLQLNEENLTLGNKMELVSQTRWLCWHCTPAPMDDVFRSTRWDGGWYLLDLKTRGRDPSTGEILAVRMAYMSNYQIQWEWSAQIQPEDSSVETDMQDSITLEELVRGLDNLEHPDAPLLLFNGNAATDFLSHAYRRFGKRFTHEYLEVDNLAVRLFGYTFCREPEEILTAIGWNGVGGHVLKDPFLARVYDLSMAAFREMAEHYDVHCPGDFNTLYGEGAVD